MIGEAAALTASCTWAIGSHLFARVGKMQGASPVAMNLGKCVSALCYFALASLVIERRLVPSMSNDSFVELGASGVVGLALGDGCYFFALVTLGVRRSILLLSTAPVWTAIGGALWLDERLSFRDAASILAVLVGVVLVVREAVPVAPSEPEQRNDGASLTGVLFGIGSGMGQAGGALLSRRALERGVTALDSSIVRLAAGAAGMIVLIAVVGRAPVAARSLFRRKLFGSIAASAFVGSFCGIWLAQYAIGHASSTAVASTLLATSPIFALPLGRFLDGEKITLRALFGTLLACAGSVALTMKS